MQCFSFTRLTRNLAVGIVAAFVFSLGPSHACVRRYS